MRATTLQTTQVTERQG